MNEMQVSQIILAQIVAGGFCPNPNAIQFAAIVALIIGFGIVTVSTGVSVITLTSTIVSLIISGANIEAIWAAIVAQTGNILVSVEMVASLYQSIRGILGC